MLILTGTQRALSGTKLLLRVGPSACLRTYFQYRRCHFSALHLGCHEDYVARQCARTARSAYENLRILRPHVRWLTIRANVSRPVFPWSDKAFISRDKPVIPVPFPDRIPVSRANA